MQRTTQLNSATAFAPTNSGTGKAGSLARFTINGNYLYALDGGKLDIVDVVNTQMPQAKKEVYISLDVETLFPYENKLFFGTQSGMLIYDLQNAETPSLISKYAHVRSCDPVVVEGNYAYVTLHDGTTCGGFSNQLEAINISDLRNPVVEKICTMDHPMGLGIDDKTLFVCDDKIGLVIFDASDVSKICENKLAQYTGIAALDIIPNGDVAMVIAKEGLYQYDYSDKKNIKLLSTLSLQP